MDTLLPRPTTDDRCALCNLPVLPGAQYVLTYDDAGDMLWWHMACRDVMIPLLLGDLDYKVRQPLNDGT